MKTINVKDNIYWVGVQDPGLRIFDIEMYTPYGTSYNSYVVKGENATALIETAKYNFVNEYIEQVKNIVDLKKIKYIIVDHTEPDHAGSVAEILRKAPNAKVVGTSVAIRFIKQITNMEFEYIEAKDGDEIDLGGKTLRFIAAPFLHWPDSMFTYIVEDKLMFTCDAFGSHYSNSKLFDYKVEEDVIEFKNYWESAKTYFDCIVSPFKPYVLKAIDKVKDLPIETICPGHGLILTKHIAKMVGLYKEWSTPADIYDGLKRVTIIYVSSYGYTRALAEKLYEGLSTISGIKPYLYDVIDRDVTESDILEKLGYSTGIMVGSPTITGNALGPVMHLLEKLNPLKEKGKESFAFGSYGWSGEAVPIIEGKLKNLKMKKTMDGVKINFKPTEDDLNKFYEIGVEFGKKVLENQN